MIVFCHLLNDHSGSPRVLRNSMQALKGFCGGVLYLGAPGSGVLDGSEFPIRHYWYRRGRHRLVTLWTYLISQISLYQKLFSSKDIPGNAVVYVNTLLPFAAMLWGRQTGRPVIVHVHEVSLSPRLLQFFLVWVATKTADLVLYVSDDNRTRLPIQGVPSLVLPNSVSTEVLRSGADSVYSHEKGGPFEVLMLASPRDFKGIPEYLSLASRFENKSRVKFTLVLNGEEKEVNRYLSKYAVPNNIDVFSRTHEPDKFYSRANLVVNLSRVDQWIETFGLTLIEAMSFGVPVIAPPVGGPTEIVTEGEEGFLIDSRDVDALEKRIRVLADDPDLMMRMSVRARRRARDFSFESFAARLREALASVEAAEG